MTTETLPSPCLPPAPAHHGDRFRNAVPTPATGTLKALKLMWQFLFRKPANTVPQTAIPVQALSREMLLAAADYSLFRLGHSTVLLKLEGGFWLTDPVFSERASPVQWAGPKRFHQPPISMADLPPLKGIILSHNHFDHLDYHAIRYLADKTEHILTPLGVGDLLQRWGIAAGKIRQLDWWQSTEIGSTRFVATPAQHFSGRGLFDANRTLWASWVVDSPQLRLFFSGDTGYFDGFKTIGEHYGPFDITLLETGAYDAQWPHVHMQPEQTLQAHLDLGGRCLMPVHNGTFDLALHAWHEPFDRISALAAQHGVTITTPAMGEALDMRAPHAGHAWWRVAQ